MRRRKSIQAPRDTFRSKHVSKAPIQAQHGHGCVWPPCATVEALGWDQAPPARVCRLPCCFCRTMLRPSLGSQARSHAVIECALMRVRHISTGSAVVSRSFVKCGIHGHGCHELRAHTSCAMPGQGEGGTKLEIRYTCGYMGSASERGATLAGSATAIVP